MSTTTTTLPSANSASANMTLADYSASDKHCVFRCGDSWFSVPAVSVREITISPPLVKVPECGSFLAGLCHLRSEFVPVIRLNSWFGVDASEYSHPHNKLLVINGNSVWGMLIADVSALESLETIVSPDARGDESQQNAVMGTAMHRDQIVRVLDPNRILRMAQQSLEDLWANPQNTLLPSRPVQPCSVKGSQR